MPGTKPTHRDDIKREARRKDKTSIARRHYLSIRSSPWFEVWIRDIKFKQVQVRKYWDFFLIETGKCDTEILMITGK